MLKKLHNPFLLSLLFGLQLSLAWPPLPTFFLLFIAFIPVFMIIKQGIANNKTAFWFLLRILPGIFVWNIGTTWWVWFASPGGTIAMIIANSLLMILVLTAAYFTMKNMPKSGFIPFIAFWIGFELFHYRWDAAYPWLTLGNGLSMFPSLIQWYEFTGVLGGSLWILLVNIVIYKGLFENKRNFIPLVLTAGLPILFSVILYFGTDSLKNNQEIEVVVAQPNLDPYNEKFDKDPEIIAQEIVSLVKEKITKNTRFLILPETALPETFELKYWDEEEKIETLLSLQEEFPELSILTGLETYDLFILKQPDCKRPTLTARSTDHPCIYYDAYNTAGFFNKGDTPVFYHKAKLVPGVEKMPFPKYLGFLESLAIDLDGTSGSLGTSPEPILFYGKDSITTCGLICYESIFGDFVRDFVNQGAQFLSIITNDGWWGNTPGYKQHLYYGSVRAIENRRYIARSANTGISCIIDHKGNILQATDWWVPAVISGKIKLSNKTTFYTRNGDLIGHAAFFISIFLFLGSLVKKKVGSR